MKIRKIKTPKNWRDLEAHPYAELLPFGVGIDIEGLATHMQRNGYDPSEPIILYEKKILMGRHRHTAAVNAEVTPTFAEFDGDSEEALELVKKDILRRHLDTSQRAMIAAELANLKKGWQTNASEEALAGTSQEDAAEAMNVSRAAVQRAAVIKEHGSQKLKDAVRKGIVSATDAEKIARAPKSVQDKALKDVMDKTAKTLAEAAKEYVDEVGKVKKKKRRKAVPAIVKDAHDREVPDRLRDVFADSTLSDEIDSLEQIDSFFNPENWVKTAGKLTTHYPFILLEKFTEQAFESRRYLQLAIASLKAGLAYAVCPKCDGAERETPCRSCRGAGHVPQHRFEELSRE